jgi:peptide/nickel transport system permease protein
MRLGTLAEEDGSREFGSSSLPDSMPAVLVVRACPRRAESNVIKVLVRRVLVSVPLLIGVSFLVFALLNLAPGDPAQKVAGPEASPQQVADVRRELGLDEPFLPRYGSWLSGLVHGDMGRSLSVSRTPVFPEITNRLGLTLSLAGLAMVFGVVIGTLSGLISVRRPYGFVDRLVSAGSSLAVATPSFLIGLVLVIAFATDRAWFPPTGYVPLGDDVVEWFRHLFLPALALAFLPAAELARQLRESLLQTLDRDYILAARAKGVRPRVVLLKHALKNAAIAPVTVMGFRAAQLLGGTVIIEQLFVLPGIGSLAVNGVLGQDQTLVLGIVVFYAVIVLAVNAVVDMTYLYFNPKLRTR